MTITVSYMDASSGAPTYTAKQARQSLAPLLGGASGRTFGGHSGWRVGTPSTVVSVTSTTWTLNPCVAMIEPGAVQYQGMYAWGTDAAVTGTVTAADATNPRVDILYIQINDSSSGDGSGALSAPVNYLAGTAAATPTAPTLPPRSFLVATISVPKSGGGAPTVTFNTQYFVSSGGVLPVTSKADRDGLNLYAGLQVCRMDRDGWVQTYNGTAWEYRQAPKRVYGDVSTFQNTVGTASRLLLTIPGLQKSYTQVMNASLKLYIIPASISSGFLGVNVAASVAQTSVGNSQGRAALAWLAPGSYALSATTNTGWIQAAANGDPFVRAWVEVTNGAVSHTVSVNPIFSEFYVDIRPADD